MAGLNTFKMKKITQLILLTILSASAAFGQVQYQLDWLPNSETYRVSMVSNQTWQAPMNIVSTAQVTLKVPSGSFEVVNTENLIEGVNFVANSRHNAPEEAADFDYISFGLETMGTDKISFVAGTTLPLFTFQNSGSCDGMVQIMTATDDFMPPNNAKANVGNHITVLGAQGNAFVGIKGEGVDCKVVGTVDIDKVPTVFNVFPNPAKNVLNMDFNWARENAEMTINIYNNTGTILLASDQRFIHGENKINLAIEELPAGMYSIEIEGDGLKMMIDKFLKLE